jgi:NAD(P) transhydrogenase subunit beta
MQQWIIDLSYLAAAVLFILALKAMASPRTARRGNLTGAAGMLIAIVFTLLSRGILTWPWIVAGLVVGSAAGTALAVTVKMTAMPQMVAMLNGFGGLASALVVIANVWGRGWSQAADVQRFAVMAAVSSVIGWVTFSGSMVAFSKLQGVVFSGRPTVFPFQRVVNFATLAVAAGLCVLIGFYPDARWLIVPVAVLAAALGVLFVIPIGGADMPVVISLLNSYSGLAAAATGFVLNNTGLIIAGALVGASGIILTRLMCKAMNRSLANVLFGAVGAGGEAREGGEERRVRSWTPEDAAMAMENASLVIIVPGYGMAVAQAQHAVKELADLLGQRGVTVKFGIHPVAGRMPGHMNVLLAEAEVPYDQLSDMEEINDEFDQADVALVIGANDVVNPAARTDKSSPIYGMPILNVDHARTAIVCKRSLDPGFAGVDNDLFYAENTAMLFGDARQTVSRVVRCIRGEAN